VIVAIGASAGGVEALRAVVGSLPPDLPAAVVVVLHLDPRHESMLAPLLGRHAQVPVHRAVQDEVLAAGTVYVAPPDHHLLVANGHVELSHSARVHYARPAIDRLFESVAAAAGARAIAVVLTGMGADGAVGLATIKRAGGTTIVQDPQSAEYPAMPRAACASGDVDHVLPLAAVGPAIAAVARGLAASLPTAVRE
jgi:two-component system chemotaxis response regulator CheB